MTGDVNDHLDLILASYLERQDRGEPCDERELMAAHPRYAGELERYFDTQRRVHVGLRGAAATGESGAGPTRLSIRCPHCAQTTAVDADSTLGEIACASCGSTFQLIDSPALSRDSNAPRRLGRFELLEHLGAGAFGSVWKARDESLGRFVAVKIPLQRRMPRAEQEKFFHEARLAARLRHPNIVSVHEVGRDGDALFIVSDYIQGASLADWLKTNRPTEREAAEFTARLAAAVHAAHECGVIHRDLKPANVLLDLAGAPHITDFGLARHDASEVAVTLDGRILGTPAYMSPEQAAGQSRDADRRSDVYSLGVILFQLLTCEVPFRGNPATLLHQVIHDDPPSPRKLNARVGPDLDTVTLKCLEKAPDARYPSAADLADELQRFLRGEPIRARPLGPAARTLRWSKRKPAMAVLSGTVVVLVASVIAVLAVSNATIRRESAAKDVALQEKETALALADKNATLERHRYYAAQMNLASQASIDGDFARTATLLETLRPAEGEVDLRGFEWRHLYHACRADADRRWLAHVRGNAVLDLVWPANVNWIAASTAGRVRIWDMEAGELLTEFILPEPQSIWDLAATDDGELLAGASSSGEVVLWNVAERREVNRWIAHTGSDSGVRAVAISPDKKWIVSGASGGAEGRSEGGLRLWDRQGRLVSTFPGSRQSVGLLSFSPDGEVLAAASFDYELHDHKRLSFWRISETPELLNELPGVGAMALAFSRDGHTVWGSMHSDERSVIAVDVDSASLRETFRGHSAFTRALTGSPQKDRVLTGCEDRTIRLWDTASGKSTIIGTELGSVNAIAVSPGGDRVVSGDIEGVISVRGVNPQPAVVELSTAQPNRPSPEIWHAMFSADGALLYLGGPSLLVLEVATGEIVERGWQNILGFSPDRSLTASHRWKVGELDIRELISGRILATLKTGPQINHVALSNDRRYAATWTIWRSDVLNLWDLSRGHSRPIKVGPTHQITDARFWPRGGRLAISAQWQPLTLWNTEDGICVEDVPSPMSNRQAAEVQRYSSDGSKLATGFMRGPILLGEIAADGSYQLRAQLRGHTGNILGLEFSPDGKQLVSTSNDGTLRFWDVATGQETATFAYSAKCAVFNPRGDQLAVIGTDNAVRLLTTASLGSM